jgi:hypothetical protein
MIGAAIIETNSDNNWLQFEDSEFRVFYTDYQNSIFKMMNGRIEKIVYKMIQLSAM